MHASGLPVGVPCGHGLSPSGWDGVLTDSFVLILEHNPV